jgi:hypothetical protein
VFAVAVSHLGIPAEEDMALTVVVGYFGGAGVEGDNGVRRPGVTPFG